MQIACGPAAVASRRGTQAGPTSGRANGSAHEARRAARAPGRYPARDGRRNRDPTLNLLASRARADTDPPIRYLVNCAIALGFTLDDLIEDDMRRWHQFSVQAAKPPELATCWRQ